MLWVVRSPTFAWHDARPSEAQPGLPLWGSGTPVKLGMRCCTCFSLRKPFAYNAVCFWVFTLNNGIGQPSAPLLLLDGPWSSGCYGEENVITFPRRLFI